MPRAPKKCAQTNCETRIIGKTYCPTHTPTNWGRGASTRTSSSEHKQWRTAVLKRDKGTCQIRDHGCTHRATEADHIIAVAFGGTTTLDNGQAACQSCHKRKTQREAIEGKRRAKG
ncbi:MAG: HNH endonuclease [Actinomycetes bacterium]